MLDFSTLFNQPDENSWKEQADKAIIEIKKAVVADKTFALQVTSGTNLVHPDSTTGKSYLSRYRTARSVLQIIVTTAVFGQGYIADFQIEIFEYVHTKLLSEWMSKF